MTYDKLFLRHVTSNKTYDFCMFSKFVNFVPTDLKIGTHVTIVLFIYINIVLMGQLMGHSDRYDVALVISCDQVSARLGLARVDCHTCQSGS